MKNENTKGEPSRHPVALFAVAAISALVGIAAVYGSLGRSDNTLSAAGEAGKAPVAQKSSAERAPLAGFVMKKAPEPIADITFEAADGTSKKLSDFKGKTVLLNLWATWCAPCREEMPALDRLQQAVRSETVEVLALAVDRGGVKAAQKFFEETKVSHLAVYADPTTRSGSSLKAVGLPTTILIDKEGRELGRLSGPATWDSDEAKALIAKAAAAP